MLIFRERLSRPCNNYLPLSLNLYTLQFIINIFLHSKTFQVVNPTFIFMVYEDNIIFSANEEVGSHSITKYDELSVTVSWNGPTLDAKFETPVVRGMAYASVLYEKLSPKITIPNLIAVNAQAN